MALAEVVEALMWPGDLIDLLERPAWMADALCREPQYAEVDFFPAKGKRLEPARAVCKGCLVRDECLAAAEAWGVRDGVWCGLSERERRRQIRGWAA